MHTDQTPTEVVGEKASAANPPQQQVSRRSLAVLTAVLAVLAGAAGFVLAEWAGPAPQPDGGFGPWGGPEPPDTGALLWFGVRLTLLVYLVLYLSTFLHELGHAAFAWGGGMLVSSFGMGMGRPLAVLDWGGTRVFFCRKNPLQGISFALWPTGRMNRRRQAAMLAGGIAANVLLALAGAALCWWRPGWLSGWVVLGWNGLMAVINAFPFRSDLSPAIRSDGGQILQLLWKEFHEAPVPHLIESTCVLRGLAEEVGDHTLLYALLVQAASAWQALGERERVEQLLREAEAVSGPFLPGSERLRAYLGALAQVVRAGAACQEGCAEDAEAALGAAEPVMCELDHAPGRFVVAIGRAEVAALRGDSAGADEQLAALAAALTPEIRAMTHTALFEARIRARAAGGDAAGLAALAAEHAAARDAHPSATGEMRVHLALARAYRQVADGKRAAGAYQEALQASEKAAAEFATPEERERFSRVQEQLQQEASAWEEEIARLEGREPVPFVPLVKPAPPATEGKASGRFVRWASAAALLTNVAATAALAVVALAPDAEPGRPVFVEVQGMRLPLRAPETLFDQVIQVPLLLNARLGLEAGFLFVLLVGSMALVPLFAGLWWLLRWRAARITVFVALMPWLCWAQSFVYARLGW